MAQWWGAYVGIPFVDCGFDRAGCHCWGLVWLVFREQCGIELPTYGEISARDVVLLARTIGANKVSEPWVEVVGERRSFDVQLMWSRVKVDGEWVRDQGHVGVMVSASHLLHVEQSTAAVCVAQADRSVRHRLLGNYRHRAFLA